ncbi:ATP-binding cassette domain-containing protein [Halanaeroarchaeum sp. HSR-CO]|nr:ATP-binding cassette domain-containing protein [Halanaeroarchaeum sp. HSR-CO]
MLEITGLTADLGEFTLNDVDLHVGEGEYFVLVGPTGSGKTIFLEV